MEAGIISQIMRCAAVEQGFSLILWNERAFSLIEIMVSLSLVALISGIAIPNLRNFNRTQEIDNASSQIINVLKTAQSSANSRIQCPAGENSSSWFVDLKTSGTGDAYSLGSVCQSGTESFAIENSQISANPTDPTSFQVNSNRCPDQTIRIYFTNLSVSYQCIGGVATPGGATITISSGANCTAPSICRNIVIEQGGTIRSE